MSQAIDTSTDDELNPGHWESLATRELQALLLHHLVIYGIQNDAAMIAPLYRLYAHCMDRTRAEERREVYQQVFRAAEERDVSLNAYMPFLLVETDLGIVATATIDYAMIGWSKEEPMRAVDELVQFVAQRYPSNRGAVFGGLVALGDYRVNERLMEIRGTLEPDDLHAAIYCHTGTSTIAALEFWLSWLETLPGDWNDAYFGECAAALARLITDNRRPFFADIERNFCCNFSAGDPPFTRQELIPIADVRKRYGRRLRALAQREPEPKILPEVLKVYGLRQRNP